MFTHRKKKLSETNYSISFSKITGLPLSNGKYVVLSYKNGKKKGEIHKTLVTNGVASWDPPERISFCGSFYQEIKSGVIEPKKVHLELKEYFEQENQSNKSLASFHIDISGFFFCDSSKCTGFGFHIHGNRCILEIYLGFNHQEQQQQQQTDTTGSLLRALSESNLIQPPSSPKALPPAVSHSDGHMPRNTYKQYGDLTSVERPQARSLDSLSRSGLNSAYGIPIVPQEPHLNGRVENKQEPTSPQNVRVSPGVRKMEVKEIQHHEINRRGPITDSEWRVAKARYGTVIPSESSNVNRKRGNTNHYDAIPEDDICGIYEDELVEQIKELQTRQEQIIVEGSPYDRIPNEEEAS